MKPRLVTLLGIAALATAALLLRRLRAEEPPVKDESQNRVPYEYGF